MRNARTIVVCLALTACVGASAQDTVLLRYAQVPGDAVVAEVASRESGTAMGNIVQAIEADVVVLSVTRAVAGDRETADEVTLEVRILLTNDGAVIINTDEGIDIGLGEMDPRGRIETIVRTSRGEVVSSVPEAEEEPLAQLVQALERMGSVLPDEPVAVGTQWTQEVAVDLPFGTAESTTTWRLDRVDEVDGRRVAALVSTSTATLTDIAVPPKTLERDVGGQMATIEVEEYIVKLTATSTTELMLDIEAGKPLGVTGTKHTDMEITQRVTVGDQTVMEHGEPFHVVRDGTLEIAFRLPTDDELIRALPLAFTNSLSREDLSLLEAYCAPSLRVGDQVGFAPFAEMLQSLFDEYAVLKATADKAKVSIDGDAGEVTFDLAIIGARQKDGPFAPVHERTTTLAVIRDGPLWRIVEFR